MAGLVVGPAALAQGALLAGALFGSQSRTSCECICSGLADDRLLAILEQQLARCVPERLAPSPAPAVASVWAIIGVFIAVLVFGASLGAVLALRFRRVLPSPTPPAPLVADTPEGRSSPVTPSSLRVLNDVRR